MKESQILICVKSSHMLIFQVCLLAFKGGSWLLFSPYSTAFVNMIANVKRVFSSTIKMFFWFQEDHDKQPNEMNNTL
jgi:hypothetical protein